MVANKPLSDLNKGHFIGRNKYLVVLALAKTYGWESQAQGQMFLVLLLKKYVGKLFSIYLCVYLRLALLDTLATEESFYSGQGLIQKLILGQTVGRQWLMNAHP